MLMAHHQKSATERGERKEQGLRSVCPLQETFPGANRHLHNVIEDVAVTHRWQSTMACPPGTLWGNTLSDTQHNCRLEYFQRPPTLIYITLTR